MEGPNVDRMLEKRERAMRLFEAEIRNAVQLFDSAKDVKSEAEDMIRKATVMKDLEMSLRREAIQIVGRASRSFNDMMGVVEEELARLEKNDGFDFNEVAMPKLEGIKVGTEEEDNE